jgi:RNA polymerase sigma factor (TIGR02999 family)
MPEVTQILQGIEEGDPKAAEQLLPLVYDELRRVAASKMSHEPPGHTLQATALVHEAWLRLVGSDQQTWQNRAHFFGAAAEAMRRILVDHARRRKAKIRGGGQVRVGDTPTEIAAPAQDDELLKVHEALNALAITDATAATLVKLHYFVGMTMPEVAQAMNVPLRTAERTWAYAKAWLRREMSRFAG